MAQKTKAQIWAEYALAVSFLSALRVLPRSTAEWAGAAVASGGYHVLGRLREIGLKNLALAFPEKSVEERKAILKRAFRHLGRNMGVVSQFDRWSPEEIRGLVEFEPTAEFTAAYEKSRAEGRGRIILGGHIGNWELQAFSFPLLFEPLTFLARRMDNPLIEDRVKRIRTRLGNRQIDKENSAPAILRALRSGGAVGFLADVNSHPKEGVFVPFFGIEACTASGVAMLALRANASIVPMWAMWDETKRKYVIVHDDIIKPVTTDDRERDIREITARYVAATERVIRRFPDQWIWIHRRWKTRPPGEEEIY